MKFARTLILAFVVTGLFAVLAACDSGSPGTTDSTKPTVNLDHSNNDAVNTGDVVVIKAQDPESGIKRIEVLWGETQIESVTYSGGEISKDQVELEVTLEAEVEPSVGYKLTVKVTNGVGLVGERSIRLYGADPDAEPGEPGGPSDPSNPTDPSGPTGDPEPLEGDWRAPRLGAPGYGEIALEFEVTDKSRVKRAVFTLEQGPDSQLIHLDDDDNDGVYVGTLNSLLYPGGEYSLAATFHLNDDSEPQTFARSLRIADQLPELTFVTPTQGAELAGRVSYMLTYDAPRGFGGVSVRLQNASGTTAIETFTEPPIAGTLSSDFLTLRVPTGEYSLLATLTDVMGNEAETELEIEILPPFYISSPGDAAVVSTDLTAITLGANGTVSDDIDIISATLYINGMEFRALNRASSSVNELLSYTWNPNIAEPGVHDLHLGGDRLLAVLVEYNYVDDAGNTEVGSRFTPGVFTKYVPDAEYRLPIDISWEAPGLGSTASGIIDLLVRIDSDIPVGSATFTLSTGTDLQTLALTGPDGDGVYIGTLNTLEHAGGEYTLTATATAVGGGSVVGTRSLTVAPQVPTIRFQADSPRPGQGMAGRVPYSISYDAPRGLEHIEVLLSSSGAGNGQQLQFDSSSGTMGSLSGSVWTFDEDQGDYQFVVTAKDLDGNETVATLPFTILPPFVIVNPKEGDAIGSGRELVTVALGMNGTINLDTEITAAQVRVNGIVIDNMDIVAAGDNYLVIYEWDTTTLGAQGGDRILTVQVEYTYEDDDGDTQLGERFTPGVLLNYTP